MTDLQPAALAAAIPTIGNEWLRGRRWFSSKNRTVAAITVSDWGALPPMAGAAADAHGPGILALARLRYDDGPDDLYLLPLIASRDPQPLGARTPAAATIEQDGVTWHVHDAFQFASFQRRLLELLTAGATLPLEQGQVVFKPEAALAEALPASALAAIPTRLVTAEQSNSSIIYGQRAILKCFRRVSAGVNPDVEVSRFLTTRAGFRATPAMFGSIDYLSREGVAHSLGLLQAFAPNRGDAWEHTLRQLARFLARAPGDGELSEQALARETIELASEQLIEISQLGRLTGELHLALASDAADPDFAPRPLTVEQLATWRTTIQRESETVLRALEQRLPELPAEQQDAVRSLLAARPQIAARIAGLAELADAGLTLTRYHGDYHLGQVLVAEAGWLILDFEGEPLRSLAERRAHSSPLKDVAGMLRSLSYAAQTGLRDAAGSSNDRAQLARWAESWEQQARAAFVGSYRSVTEGAPFTPRSAAQLDAALAIFELEKALYELNYELNNRPDWLLIPLRGILRAL
jgi:trehalose synthase-fused probable maltokinase